MRLSFCHVLSWFANITNSKPNSYWENEEEGSLFLVWNPVENEATGDLKLWVFAVQEKKGRRKKEKILSRGLTPFIWFVKLDRCQNFK